MMTISVHISKSFKAANFLMRIVCLSMHTAYLVSALPLRTLAREVKIERLSINLILMENIWS